MYQFTDDCRIGIPQIDKEHEYLFKLVNEAYEALSSSKENRIAVVREILEKLQEYAKTHFAHEEAYMEGINDPELPLQKREHTAFINEIDSLIKENNMDADVLREVLSFLTRWLYHHILSSDLMIGKMEVATKDKPFAFTQNFHTGITLIDEEHKTLFDIIGRTHELIHAELLHDKYDEIMSILGELKTYTEKHFKDEEAYMEKIQYPKLEQQKIAHAAFIEKLVDIDLFDIDEMDDNQQEYLEGLIDFLSSWLINHILQMDKPIADL